MASAAREAIKQCGAPWLPQVEQPLTPGSFWREGILELPLIASPGWRQPPGAGIFQHLPGDSPPPAAVPVFDRPEGD